jgi:Tfp pilus assembly protein FimV
LVVVFPQEAQLQAKVAVLKASSLEEAARHEELEQRLGALQRQLDASSAELQACQGSLDSARAQKEEQAHAVEAAQQDKVH